MTAPISPLEALADELGDFAARVERELRLASAALHAELREGMASLRAARAEFELSVERAIAERLAALKDGAPGPQGERGEPGLPGEAIAGPAGEQGVPGPPGTDSTVPGPEPYVGEVCGLFDPERQYRKFDLVTWHGSEWRAREDDPGGEPGNVPGWVISAQTGSRGKPGERGDRGPAGPALAIASWEMRDYRALPVMTDGSVGPALDLRELFEQYDIERG